MKYLRFFRIDLILGVILSQLMLRQFLLRTFYQMHHESMLLSDGLFALLILASALVVSTFPFYSDKFDLRVPQPFRRKDFVLGALISEKWANAYCLLAHISAIAIGLFVGYRCGFFNLGWIFFVLSMLIYYDALRYKRLFFWRNFVPAVILFMLLMTPWLYEFFALKTQLLTMASLQRSLPSIWSYAVLFAAVGSMLWLIIQVFYDFLHIDEQEKLGYETLPLAMGVAKAKNLQLVFLILLIAVVGFLQYQIYQSGNQYLVLMLFCMLQLPAIFLMYYTAKAKLRDDFLFSFYFSIGAYLLFLGAMVVFYRTIIT